MDRGALQYRRMVYVGSLLVSLVVGGAHCVAQPLAPDALRDLLQEDQAAGFEAATQSFEAAKAAGDLNLMLQILRVAVEPSRQCWYTLPLDDMVRGAAERAQALGKWEAPRSRAS